MNLITSTTPIALWQDVIKHAEDRCSVRLKEDLETYLISLLIRYTNKPDVAKSVLGKAFLEAMQLRHRERNLFLQCVGDECLIFAGLFPRAAQKKHVKINYFVDLGRAAYANITGKTNNVFNSLSLQFVLLMDVLQSIPQHQELLPLEAYEQWDTVGSKRALQIMQQYARANVFTLKSPKR